MLKSGNDEFSDFAQYAQQTIIDENPDKVKNWVNQGAIGVMEAGERFAFEFNGSYDKVISKEEQNAQFRKEHPLIGESRSNTVEQRIAGNKRKIEERKKRINNGTASILDKIGNALDEACKASYQAQVNYAQQQANAQMPHKGDSNYRYEPAYVDKTGRIVYNEIDLRKKIGFSEALADSVQQGKALPFVSGAIEGSAIKKVRDIENKIKNSEPIRQDELDYYNRYIDKQNEEYVRGYTIGGQIGASILPSLLAFGGEMALGGAVLKRLGLAGLGKAGGLNLGKNLLRSGKVSKNVAKGIAYTSGQLAEGGINAAITSTVNPARLYATYQERRLNDEMKITDRGTLIFSESLESPAKSFFKSLEQIYISYFTENMGGLLASPFKAGGKAIKSVGASQFAKVMENNPALEKLIQKTSPIFSKAYEKLNNLPIKGKSVEWLKSQVKFDGFLEELGEEVLEDVLNLTAGTTNEEKTLKNYVSKIVKTPEEWAVLCGVIALLGTALSVAGNTLGDIMTNNGAEFKDIARVLMNSTESEKIDLINEAIKNGNLKINENAIQQKQIETNRIKNKFFTQYLNAGVDEDVAYETATLESLSIESLAKSIDMDIAELNKKFNITIKSMTDEEANEQFEKDNEELKKQMFRQSIDNSVNNIPKYIKKEIKKSASYPTISIKDKTLNKKEKQIVRMIFFNNIQEKVKLKTIQDFKEKYGSLSSDFSDEEIQKAFDFYNKGNYEVHGEYKPERIETQEVLNPDWRPVYTGTETSKEEIIEDYESRTSTDKIGHGYNFYSMSNNAVKAYSQGSMPISKWNKKNILERISNIINEYSLPVDLSKLDKLKVDDLKNYLKQDGYHHTSKFYNSTDFYKIDIEKLLNLIQEDSPNIYYQGVINPKNDINQRTDKTKYLTDNEVEQLEKDKENFETYVNKLIKGELSPLTQIRVLEKLTSAYNNIPSLKGKKVVITQDVYKKIIDLPNRFKKNHYVDRKRAIKLPQLIADPLYILKSTSEGNEHRFVVVTSSKNNIPAQRLSIFLNPNNSVAVVSAYDEEINISEEKKAGRVLYDKKKELLKTLSASKAVTMNNSNTTITNFANNFNPNVNNHEENPNIYYQSAISKKTSQKAREVLNALQKIANGSEEETVKDLRNDLEQYGGTNDVTFIFGNNKKGIQHIAQKHGAKTLLKVFDTVIDGNVIRYSDKKKTVIIGKDNYEAVLSLDENGNKKTWLLSGWDVTKPKEKSSDVNSEVSTQSVTTQIKPTFSRQDLGAELNNIITDDARNLNPNVNNHEESPNVYYQSKNKNSALDYDYITNQITGAKIKIEMNEDIKVDKIEPQKISSELPFKVSQKTGENRRQIINNLGLIKGHKIYVANNNTNEKAYISRDTIKKSISNINKNFDYKDFIEIIYDIENLFKTSQKILSYKDAKQNTDTIIKRYANIAKGNKADYLLEFTLKDNGEIELYGVNIINNEAVSKNTYPKMGSALETANYSIANIKDIFKSKLVEKYNNDYKNSQLRKILEGQVIYDLSSVRPQENLARSSSITNFQGDFNPNVNNHEENPNIYYQNAATNYQEQFENIKANLNYKQFVNKVFDNKLSKQEKSKPFQIGKTPAKLIQAGFPDNNISIGYKIIEKAQDNRNPDHNLSKETIREVYQALDNPIAVIKAEQNKNEKTPNNRYSVVVDLKDDAEKYVLVAFEINKKDGNILLNDIRSIHSRKDYTPLIDKAFNENRLIKIDRDKIKDLLTPKIQPDIISGGVASLIENIYQQKNDVKFFQSPYKSLASNYSYIHNQVTGEKINIEMNEDIKVDKIEPQKISSELPFEISKKPSDNKKSLIKTLGLGYGKFINAVNNNTGETAKINNKTIEKSLSNISVKSAYYNDFCNIVLNVETLFKTSQKILNHRDTKTDSDININRYANIAKINENDYLLEFVLKDNGEVKLYSVDIINNKKQYRENASSKNSMQHDTAISSITNIKDIFKSKLIKKSSRPGYDKIATVYASEKNSSAPREDIYSIANIKDIFKSKLVKKYNNDYKNSQSLKNNLDIHYQEEDNIENARGFTYERKNFDGTTKDNWIVLLKGKASD